MVKKAILLKAIYMFSATPITILMTFITENEKSNHKRSMLEISKYPTSNYATEL
jgi:hypothetical protein